MYQKNNLLRRFALLFLLLSVTVSALTLTSCKKKNAPLDYLHSDLSPYILLPENRYLGHEIAVTLDEITELDVENALLQTQTAYKNKTPENDGAFLLDHTLSAGDVVYLYFTPYYWDESGTRVDCYTGETSNFASSSGLSPVNQSPDSLEIGSGTFGAGFELSLIGKNPKDYAKFDYADVGGIRPDDTLFITYTAFRTTESNSYEEGRTACIRPDDQNVDALYGIGFRDLFSSGEYEIGKTYNNVQLPLPDGENEQIVYSSLKVNFVRHASALPVMTVEAHFAKNYGYDVFAGRTVTFEVFVQKCVAYQAPEIDETFIRETVGLTEDDLSVYEGSLREKYKSYLREALENDRKAEALAEAEAEMWNYLKDAAEVLKYPEKEVDRINEMNRTILENYYKEYSSSYPTLDQFAVAYFNLEQGSDWQTYMQAQTKIEVKERLILYSIMRAQNILPTEEEYRRQYDAIVKDIVDYYADEWGVDRSYFSTDEDYQKALENVKKEVLEYFGEEYFVENTYYQYAGNRILALFRVTLNGKPVDVPIA